MGLCIWHASFIQHAHFQYSIRDFAPDYQNTLQGTLSVADVNEPSVTVRVQCKNLYRGNHVQAL